MSTSASRPARAPIPSTLPPPPISSTISLANRDYQVLRSRWSYWRARVELAIAQAPSSLRLVPEVERERLRSLHESRLTDLLLLKIEHRYIAKQSLDSPFATAEEWSGGLRRFLQESARKREIWQRRKLKSGSSCSLKKEGTPQ